MPEVRFARGEELAQTERLWTRVFGDDSRFQREFYALCGVEAPLILAAEEGVQAMLALPRLTLTMANGTTVPCGYVYALATAPESRGKGYAARLLEGAAQLLAEQGIPWLLTVPARPDLFDFFARNGFRRAFFHREMTAQPGPCRAERITPEEYAALRESLLAGRTHISHTPSQLAMQSAMCRQEGSGLYRLELDHAPGCAAVENHAHYPLVKELLCLPEDEAQGMAAAAALCGREARLRLPVPEGEGTAFAAARPLLADGGELCGYFGFGWD